MRSILGHAGVRLVHSVTDANRTASRGVARGSDIRVRSLGAARSIGLQLENPVAG